MWIRKTFKATTTPTAAADKSSQGGAVDKNLAATYTAAKAAGITNIDAYMFPCTSPPPLTSLYQIQTHTHTHTTHALTTLLGTGSQPTGVACKSITTQINEFLAAIDDKKIPVNHLWLDIEPEDASNPGVQCNAWQLGSAGNEALAKKWVAAIKATGRKWGIYANR